MLLPARLFGMKTLGWSWSPVGKGKAHVIVRLGNDRPTGLCGSRNFVEALAAKMIPAGIPACGSCLRHLPGQREDYERRRDRG